MTAEYSRSRSAARDVTETRRLEAALRAQAARLALLDGYAGAVWAVDGTPRVVIGFTVEDSRIVEIELLADPEGLARLDLAPVEG